jgi:hypothetical protein
VKYYSIDTHILAARTSEAFQNLIRYVPKSPNLRGLVIVFMEFQECLVKLLKGFASVLLCRQSSDRFFQGFPRPDLVPVKPAKERKHKSKSCRSLRSTPADLIRGSKYARNVRGLVRQTGDG